MNEAAHTISLTSPSKLSSSFNTSNRDPASFILNERETRFASGMELDSSNKCHDPFDTKEFWTHSPEILVEWIAPIVSACTAKYNSLQLSILGSFF